MLIFTKFVILCEEYIMYTHDKSDSKCSFRIRIYTDLYTYIQLSALLMRVSQTADTPNPKDTPTLSIRAVMSIHTVQFRYSWCLNFCLANA